MKVLIIEHFSEANLYSVELGKQLGQLVDLTILTTYASKIDCNNINFKCLKKLCGFNKVTKLVKSLDYLKSLYFTSKEIILGKYDIVHLQTFRFFRIEILLYLLLKPFISKLIYTAHNIVPHEEARFDRLFFKLIYKLSDQIIVHNETSKITLLDEFHSLSKNKITVIPHGIYSLYTDSVAYSKSSPKHRKVILFFGLIRQYKGLDILLEALTKIPKSYYEQFEVVVAGHKINQEDYGTYIRSNDISEIVKLDFRFIPDSEVPVFFNQCDCVILPYRKIYGSGALLLSYSFTKPVIVSDIPSFIEETDNGKTGYIFTSEDSSDLALKIKQFLASDERTLETFKSNINRLVNDKYNWKTSAKLTYELYKGRTKSNA